LLWVDSASISQGKWGVEGGGGAHTIRNKVTNHRRVRVRIGEKKEDQALTKKEEQTL
jgi:hypothetical protein